MATKIIEIPEDELRKIHYRLDVQDQAMKKIVRILYLNGYMNDEDRHEISEMLEESQNPFEVSDGQEEA